MIKYSIKQSSGSSYINFTVTRQDKIGIYFGIDGSSRTFTASNGFELASEMYPEFSIYSHNTLYVRGNAFDKNNYRLRIPIVYIYNVIFAIDEYNCEIG